MPNDKNDNEANEEKSVEYGFFPTLIAAIWTVSALAFFQLLGDPANAATPYPEDKAFPSAKVHIGDLDLRQTSDMRKLERRVLRTARALCDGDDIGRRLGYSRSQQCIKSTVDHAMQNLAARNIEGD